MVPGLFLLQHADDFALGNTTLFTLHIHYRPIDVHLFICGLINDAVNSSVYIVSNE